MPLNSYVTLGRFLTIMPPRTPVRICARLSRFSLAAAVLALHLACPLQAQTTPPAPVPVTPVAIENTNAAFVPTDVAVPQANPARPTVTIPAHIPPTGYLQFEQGFNQADSSPAGTRRQSALLQTTKISLTTRLLVQFITEPYAYSAVASGGARSVTSSDPGALLLGVQGIVYESVGAVPTIDLGYIRRVRTGTSANLDAGDYSNSVLLFLGGDLRHGFHYDSNVIVNEQNNGAVRRAQFGQTLAISHGLFPTVTHQRLGGIVELSHFTQPFTTDTYSGLAASRANTLDLLFAATYTLRPNLVFDAAFTHGFTSTSTQWQGAFGVTYLLPRRLWTDRHPVILPIGRHRH